MSHNVATELGSLEFYPEFNQQIISKIAFNKNTTQMKWNYLDFCHHLACYSTLFFSLARPGLLQVDLTFKNCWECLRSLSEKLLRMFLFTNSTGHRYETYATVIKNGGILLTEIRSNFISFVWCFCWSQSLKLFVG